MAALRAFAGVSLARHGLLHAVLIAHRAMRLTVGKFGTAYGTIHHTFEHTRSGGRDKNEYIQFSRIATAKKSTAGDVNDRLKNPT